MASYFDFSALNAQLAKGEPEMITRARKLVGLYDSVINRAKATPPAYAEFYTLNQLLSSTKEGEVYDSTTTDRITADDSVLAKVRGQMVNSQTEVEMYAKEGGEFFEFNNFSELVYNEIQDIVETLN